MPPTSASPTTGGDGLSDRVLTIPNAISLLRLVVLLPIVVWLLTSGHYWWALVALLALGSSDWLDGYLARRLGQRSLLGTRLDPVADRISVVVVSLTLSIVGLLPWWMLLTIAVVDLVLLVEAAVLFRGSPDLPVSRIGKWRTAALFAGLPMLIVAQASDVDAVRWIALALMAIGVVGHVIAGAGYAAAMRRRARA